MTVTNTEYFGIQRKIVANMTSESWQSIPHVCYNAEIDFSNISHELNVLNAKRKNEDRFSVNTVVLKMLCEGLKAAPQMNAHISFNKRLVRGKVDTIEEINISMPAILPNGKMMTLNLRDFGNKDLDEMTFYINDLLRKAQNTNLDEAMFEVSFIDTLKEIKKGKIAKAFCRLIGSKLGSHRIKTLSGRERKEYLSIPKTDRLTFRDLEQGTVTVSNIGSLYKEQAGQMTLLEIVPPQVAAFGVGALTDKPYVFKNDRGEKEIGIKTVLPVCIAFDHRALDFGDIIPFIKRLDEISRSPEVILKIKNDTKSTRCA